MKRPLIVGNWKMHGTRSQALLLSRSVARGLQGIGAVEVVLAPPYTALAAVGEVARGGGFRLAAQNLHWESSGAFTGEISPGMLKEVGCRFVIIGHSERRHLFHESDRWIAKKVAAALEAGLAPIVCVGETLKERKRGTARRAISRQVRAALKGTGKNVIERVSLAYEPVWAIGTGHHATPEQVGQAHGWIADASKALFGRTWGRKNRILYGGSVKPDNVTALAEVPEVEGLLVGGASLKGADFLKIIWGFRDVKLGQHGRS